ncbi:c-type cytochrome [Leptolyngbya sp. PCC 6406]|uniref:c-type cytochrome n=1 Tax=Leptolyngbya sp. PCC 6406 TaxID=1173264 RepID=UPI0006879A7E|nr:cytochrome c [Leptolyngbya sp. PCC 6406]
MTERTVSEPLQPSALIWRVVLLITLMGLLVGMVIFGFRQAQAADPYIQQVLTLRGDEVRGQAIFQMNCAVCHGIAADGEVGPSLQQVSSHLSKIGLINQVVSGKTPPMPQFQPDPQDMADLLEYLEAL